MFKGGVIPSVVGKRVRSLSRFLEEIRIFTSRSDRPAQKILRGNLPNNDLLAVSRQPQVLPHHRRHPRL
ncbi:hypothetical protein PQG02_31965 (plasmid) [Nostoc sp. UHCC 0926]|nr:hypothetical protein PQG02_31965 [Nostoc sp. UHCC 0926]